MSEKRVLITGASGLIGRSLVAKYAEAGWQVIAPSSSECDLSIAGRFKKFIAACGKLELLINNAADQRVLDPRVAEPTAITRAFQINSVAILEGMVAAKESGAATCINISSIEAFTPRSGHEIYGATKAALESLTKSMANALAPMRVNGVRLGLIGDESLAARWPEGVAAWRSAVPAARYASPEEAANFIFTVSGEEFSYATGAIFDFDGGKSASPGW